MVKTVRLDECNRTSHCGFESHRSSPSVNYMTDFHLYNEKYLVEIIFEDETHAVIKWIDHKSMPDELLSVYPHVPITSLAPAPKEALEDVISIEMSDEAFEVLERMQHELGLMCIAHVITHIIKTQLNTEPTEAFEGD